MFLRKKHLTPLNLWFQKNLFKNNESPEFDTMLFIGKSIGVLLFFRNNFVDVCEADKVTKKEYSPRKTKYFKAI